jgi:hypothetical protein
MIVFAFIRFSGRSLAWIRGISDQVQLGAGFELFLNKEKDLKKEDKLLLVRK